MIGRTPGFNQKVEFVLDGGVIRTKRHGTEVARLLEGPLDQDEAGRLLASAPELFEALKEAVHQLNLDYEPTPLDGRGALIRKLESVIEKARGAA